MAWQAPEHTAGRLWLGLVGHKWCLRFFRHPPCIIHKRGISVAPGTPGSLQKPASKAFAPLDPLPGSALFLASRILIRLPPKGRGKATPDACNPARVEPASQPHPGQGSHHLLCVWTLALAEGRRRKPENPREERGEQEMISSFQLPSYPERKVLPQLPISPGRLKADASYDWESC